MILPSLVFFVPSADSALGGISNGIPVGMDECEVLAATLRKPSGSLRSDARRRTEPGGGISNYLHGAARHYGLRPNSPAYLAPRQFCGHSALPNSISADLASSLRSREHFQTCRRGSSMSASSSRRTLLRTSANEIVVARVQLEESRKPKRHCRSVGESLERLDQGRNGAIKTMKER
jgi:hypothetical protein